MPATYRIYAEIGLVHSEARGTLRGDEMIAHAHALAADPAFSPGYSQFTDFRPTTAFEASSQDIRRLVEANPFSRAARRVALVGSPVAFGMLRMYQIIADIEDTSSLVTHDEADAWAFLKLTPGDVPPGATSVWASAPTSPGS